MIKNAVNEILKYKKSIFWIVVFLFLFSLLLPDKQSLEQTLNEIKGASWNWIILGSIIYYLTIPIYALQIFVLSKTKLSAWITYKVQMAVLFINKFLPSSISSFVMNSFYLSRLGRKPSEVASVITMQGITSGIPFMILFAAAILIGISQYNITTHLGSTLGEIHWFKVIVLILIVILAIVFAVKSSTKLENFVNKTFGSLWNQLKTFKDRPLNLFWALLTGLVAPLFGVSVLYASGHSVDLPVTFIEAFLIYALGTTMANLVPIPGGIGAAEAGLYAGFTFFGYPGPESWAATLIYRIITFWIPTIPGFIFFINLRKDVLKGFSISNEFSKIKRSKKK